MVGHDTAGLPVYSGNKVRYGNCSGALEVYYGWAPAYYQGLMTSPLEPLFLAAALQRPRRCRHVCCPQSRPYT